MARIRTIKPEFPQSESVGKLSRDARLLFVLIWTHVDDEGRARAASRMLASLLFPYDDDAPKLIEGWLGDLERNGFIQRYEVDGSRYMQVVNWLKHQKIDHPSKSKIPAFEESLAKPREVSRDLAPDLGPRTLDQEEGEPKGSPCPKPSKSVRTRIDYPSDFEDWWKAYPTDQNMSKAEALKAWRQLGPEDRQKAIAAAPRFRIWCRQQKDYRTIHAERWLSKRRFDGFAPQADEPERTLPLEWAQTA